MGSSRKAKARRKTTHTKVKVGLLKSKKRVPVPVVLPGTDQSTPWVDDTTLTRNYKALGLALDPNGARGRINPVRATPMEEEPAEPTLGELAETDADSMRVALGQHLPRGMRPPKKLTAMQMGIMRTLVEAHGDDVVAMTRDLKHNAMQHTAGKLRVLLASYHAYAGKDGGRHEFRAPKKRL